MRKVQEVNKAIQVRQELLEILDPKEMLDPQARAALVDQVASKDDLANEVRAAKLALQDDLERLGLREQSDPPELPGWSVQQDLYACLEQL